MPIPLVGYLTGPTAVGKTEVALSLAEKHGWVILSVDSRQIYRDLDIGTAKPSADERARVRHLLIDRLDPGEPCSAGRFRALALEELARLRASGTRALAVGGAGLYWEALVRGLHPLPPSSPEIRRQHERILREEGVAELYRRLQEVDPDMAARLRPRDRQRIGRALEVTALAGEPMSRILARPVPDSFPEQEAYRNLPVVALRRPREELYLRIEQRCRQMCDAGLVEELRSLLRRGVSPDAPGLRSVGYREFLPHLLQAAPLTECIESFVSASRRYAKRQETWLRHRLPERHEIWIGEQPPELQRSERPSEVGEQVAEQVAAILGGGADG